MINKKYTKGPWIADGNGFEKSYNISNGEKSICDVSVSRADADLIAAAPEMLETLEVLFRISELEKGSELHHQVFCLIKKARGE